MPAWAEEALTPATFAFLNLILEICRAFPAYTVEGVLDLPIARFWAMLENVRRHQDELAEAAKQNPVAGLALLLGR